MNNQLGEALDAYITFKSLPEFEKIYNLGITEEAIKSVETAKVIQDDPVNLFKHCFESPVNTGSKEYKAVISANEQVMVWMSSEKLYEAIMMSTKEDGEWTPPVNITPQLGSDGNMFPTGLSADGTELLLIKKETFDSNIYYSKFEDGRWQKAEWMEGRINSNSLENHASFHPDGTKILISSARRGTEGGLDIWISNRVTDSTWSKPVNAGEKINTKADETSAYFSPDGNKLIFCSKGHFNMGGYDIFTSNIAADGSFETPVNIGYPVNTTTDNIFFVPMKDGKSGIYCMRDDEGIGSLDIWYLEILKDNQAVPKMTYHLSNHDFIMTFRNKDTGENTTWRYDAAADTMIVISGNSDKYEIEYGREKDD